MIWLLLIVYALIGAVTAVKVEWTPPAPRGAHDFIARIGVALCWLPLMLIGMVVSAFSNDDDDA